MKALGMFRLTETLTVNSNNCKMTTGQTIVCYAPRARATEGPLLLKCVEKHYCKF